MAASGPEEPSSQIGKALVDFSLRGAFPEEDASSLALAPEALPPAIEALTQAKAKLEAEIHAINEETAEDVASWRANAKSVQDDIVRSKALANDILKQADTPDVSGKRIADIEAKTNFLARELNYNRQVQDALRGIRAVNQTLDQVEQARDERRILDALHLLEKSWTQLDQIPVSRSTRALKLLDIRAFELKNDVHGVFDHVWKALVHVDIANGSISVTESREGEHMSLSDAVTGLQAYKEVDKRMKDLWHDVDQAIFTPRMDAANPSLPGILVQNGVLQTAGTADKTISSLFKDLEQIFGYLVEKLPSDLVASISSVMMPEVMTRITNVWLDSAVPSSLRDMDEFQQVITVARHFCRSLDALGLKGLGELQEWVDSAPRVWLSKCREAALDSVRSRLAEGIGSPTQVERVEKQMVSRMESKELTVNTPAAMADVEDHGWGDAWSDEETKEEANPSKQQPAPDQHAADEDDGTDAWGAWNEDDDAAEGAPEKPKEEHKDDEQGPADAWGWGDDGQTADENNSGAASKSTPSGKPQAAQYQATRELTLKETYYISSMPEPVLALIFALVEDGAALTQEHYENSPVAAAAAGLFSLPILALAMFRAISPHYYASDIGGNMYLYNDANYISEKLSDFAMTWKERSDISARAKAMLRLDNDIKSLQDFATRAYSNEMNTQKVILRDLLGGEQNLMHQDETESCIEMAVARVRSMAVTWESILARSVWYQAVGSLVDALSSKIIADIMDMSAIGQDEAYNIAKMISTVTELDDLFLPSRSGSKRAEEADEVPTTSHYASTWLRLKYLSEVLQSNLRDLRYLWMESELSYYFSVDEVLDLINMSFEDNPRTREVVREITQNPYPRQEEQGHGSW